MMKVEDMEPSEPIFIKEVGGISLGDDNFYLIICETTVDGDKEMIFWLICGRIYNVRSFQVHFIEFIFGVIGEIRWIEYGSLVTH